MNQRQLALEILYNTIDSDSYANLSLRKQLNKIPLIQRGLVTELVYGTLRNFDLLIYQFKDEVSEKTKLKLKLIIVLALYERFYLKQKDYVVNNEYCNLADNKYDKAFINALLHKVKTMKKADESSIEGISINYSLPIWITNLINKQYSKEEFENILNVYNSKAKTYYRLNKKRASYEDLNKYSIQIINEHMFTALISLTNTPEFKNGYFYIQDINSSELINHLDLKNESLFLDMCSAPGSKLFNALETVKENNCYSNDVNANRVELIKSKAKVLGYEDINFFNYDGRELKDKLDIRFDRILLDAPCSGLGVISRKPDIKFHIKPESLDEIQILQKELLESAYELLANKGILLYSTCTINKKENSKQINNFINLHKDLKLIEENTIISIGGDCFYFAKIIKE